MSMETGKITGESHYACREIVAERDALAARLAEAERLLSGCRTSFGFVNSILHESIDAFLRPADSADEVQR